MKMFVIKIATGVQVPFVLILDYSIDIHFFKYKYEQSAFHVF
jgi:hypothetical protein